VFPLCSGTALREHLPDCVFSDILFKAKIIQKGMIAMSGGHYEYIDYRIRELADQVGDDITHMKRETEYPYSPAIIHAFEFGKVLAELTQIYSRRMDYFMSGDDSEESFFEYLGEELEKLRRSAPKWALDLIDLVYPFSWRLDGVPDNNPLAKLSYVNLFDVTPDSLKNKRLKAFCFKTLDYAPAYIGTDDFSFMLTLIVQALTLRQPDKMRELPEIGISLEEERMSIPLPRSKYFLNYTREKYAMIKLLQDFVKLLEFSDVEVLLALEDR
jgi:hypothetical protein